MEGAERQIGVAVERAVPRAREEVAQLLRLRHARRGDDEVAPLDDAVALVVLLVAELEVRDLRRDELPVRPGDLEAGCDVPVGVVEVPALCVVEREDERIALDLPALERQRARPRQATGQSRNSTRIPCR